MTDATLGASGLWLGTRIGAGGTATLTESFFGRSPWLHGQQVMQRYRCYFLVMLYVEIELTFYRQTVYKCSTSSLFKLNSLHIQVYSPINSRKTQSTWKYVFIWKTIHLQNTHLCALTQCRTSATTVQEQHLCLAMHSSASWILSTEKLSNSTFLRVSGIKPS